MKPSISPWEPRGAPRRISFLIETEEREQPNAIHSRDMRSVKKETKQIPVGILFIDEPAEPFRMRRIF